MVTGSRQRGVVTLIGALFIIITVALMVEVLHRIAGTDILDTASQNDAIEALFVVETGIEHALFVYGNGTPCNNLNGLSAGVGRGVFTVTSAIVLTPTDCRVRVQGNVTSTVAANQASRVVDADLRLGANEGWAVGNNGTILALNAGAWTISTSGTTENLHGIHCTDSSNCWAVGDSQTILYWNGSSWAQQYSDASGTLNAVSCEPANPLNCYAVGQTFTNVFGKFAWPTTLVLHWDGSNWNDDGGTYFFNNFLDVSCPDADCYAVASNGQAMRSASGWGNDNSMSPVGLNGIDCTASSDCWAVGNQSAGDFNFDQRDNTGWTPSTLGSASLNEDLRSVSCFIAANCKAVGDRKGGRFTLVSWNGVNWQTESFNHTNREDLRGVHCRAADDCWAVGVYRSGRATGNSLNWDGNAWIYVGTPVTEDLNDVFTFPAGATNVTLVRWEEIISN